MEAPGHLGAYHPHEGTEWLDAVVSGPTPRFFRSNPLNLAPTTLDLWILQPSGHTWVIRSRIHSRLGCLHLPIIIRGGRRLRIQSAGRLVVPTTMLCPRRLPSLLELRGTFLFCGQELGEFRQCAINGFWTAEHVSLYIIHIVSN